MYFEQILENAMNLITRALKCKPLAGDMIIKKHAVHVVCMTELSSSNSGAIKLSQAGGMLKH